MAMDKNKGKDYRKANEKLGAARGYKPGTTLAERNKKGKVTAIFGINQKPAAKKAAPKKK